MKASRKLHPDKGGDGDRFRNMNECYKENKDTLSCSEESKITSSIAEAEEEFQRRYKNGRKVT